MRLLLFLFLPASLFCENIPNLNSSPEPKRLKIFLADCNDLPCPPGYTPSFFHELFFGSNDSLKTPEGKFMGKSVRDYFLDVSQGTLDIQGEVMDWVRIDRDIAKIPHWKSGMEPFGESWPIIVAETLRAHELAGEGAQERLRLSDGKMPNFLVFLNTDWGIGGCNRGWPRLKEVLDIMGESHLWDSAWLEFPSPYSSFSATVWRDAPASYEDGTIDSVPPDVQLELFPVSIMMHEMGHQLAGLPDLYSPSYAPWGVFDLMGGPAANSHFSMGLSAFLRVKAGWMEYTDLSRESHERLFLRPLETHREAFRFFQGPGQEFMVAENRWHLEYPWDYGTPPVNQGPCLLLYRVDPNGRHRSMVQGNPYPRFTTMIRRPEPYGEVWGKEGFTEVTAMTTPSSHNSLGELWWEFYNISQGPDEKISFDAIFRAKDCTDTIRKGRWPHHLPRIENEGPPRLYLEMRDCQPGFALDLPARGRYSFAKEVAALLGPRWKDKLKVGWLVPTARTLVDLMGILWMKETTSEQDMSLCHGLILFGDEWHYGPVTCSFTLPTKGTGIWSTKRSIMVPEKPTILRIHAGLEDSAPPGTPILLSLSLVEKENTWDLMKRLPLGKEFLSVIETKLPTACQGNEVHMRLELETDMAGPVTVHFPCFRLTDVATPDVATP